MFAFAIWDASAAGAVCWRAIRSARSRSTTPPQSPAIRFCFASELKALAALPGFDSRINPRSVADFLAFGYVADPDTIYRNVAKLPPGSSLLVSRGRASAAGSTGRLRFDVDDRHGFQRSGRRSSVGTGRRQRGAADDERRAAGRFSERRRRFERRRRADGTALRQRVKSFSIGFTRRRVRRTRVRAHGGRRATRRSTTKKSSRRRSDEMLRTLVDHYDEPFADSSAIPTLYLSRMTRQHVTVALSGDGADELFGGYRRYRFAVAESTACGVGFRAGSGNRCPQWPRRFIRNWTTWPQHVPRQSDAVRALLLARRSLMRRP